MFFRLGEVLARYWYIVIVAWIVAAVGLHLVAPAWDDVTHDGDLAYLPPRMTSVRGEKLFAEAFGATTSKSQLVVVLKRSSGDLTGEDFEFTERLGARLIALSDLPITGVWTPQTDIVGTKLVSRDRRVALVLLLLSTEFMATRNIAVVSQVEALLAEAKTWPGFPTGLELGVSGSAAVGGDMLRAAAESISRTEMATVALVLVILLLVYRAPLLTLVPLVTIAISVLMATDVVALMTQIGRISGWEWFDFKVFKTTRIFIVVLLFGAGTDFCLFLIARYKEELSASLNPAMAAARSLGAVGEAIVASAMTTILGLGTMVFADFGKYRNGGPAIAVALAVTLGACLTLAPALLRAFGSALFWPRRIQFDAGAGDSVDLSRGLWAKVADFVLARPGLVLVASVALLMPLAWRGTSVELTYDLLGELSPERPSRKGTALLRGHFAAGETGPITVLAHGRQLDFESPEGEHLILQLTEALYEFDPAIVAVRSLAAPLGERPRVSSPLTKSGITTRAARNHPRSRLTFLGRAGDSAGLVARFDIVSKYKPFSRESIELVQRIDDRLVKLAADAASPWHGAEFDLVGPSSGLRDLRAVTTSDQVRIERLVVIVVLAVLIAVLRRPMVCLFLIASVLFSYFVTIGATEWLFGRLFADYEGLDWKVPLYLFVILVAVGEDYNIYLMSRVVEEQKIWGTRQGLRRAMIRTGGIISSCGVIMAGTFSTMMTGSLRGMLELGFALSAGVMLDTFVVRPVLVPAFLALAGRFVGSFSGGDLTFAPVTLPSASEPAEISSRASGS